MLCVCCRYFLLSPLKLKQPPELRLCDTCLAQRDPELGNKKSWEDLCVEQLLPQITYADGMPFPPDQQDERKGGGLGTSRAVKRRRECDTTTNRFPDLLWIRRDAATARPLLAVLCEIDEHSHPKRNNYTASCEAGKIDDTFQSIQVVAAKEGASKHAVGRSDAIMIPILFLKLNPNACDSNPSVPLSNRLGVSAGIMNRFLNMEEPQIAEMCHRGMNQAPIVQCLYYHSQDGGHILEHFDEHASSAGWRWLGNHCGTDLPELPF